MEHDSLLTVCLITYNHKNYIDKAIEGVLMQETNFPFKLLIADDFSTDGTRVILKAYRDKFPDKIELILQEQNVGAEKNWMALMTFKRSKYLAYFEGDDYWIDRHKLQMQVDFLESNSDYGLVHTGYKNYIQNTGTFKTNTLNQPDTDSSFDYLLTNNNSIGTLTVCFRRDLFVQYINDVNPFNRQWKLGDLPLWLYIARNSKIKYLPYLTAVYRVQNESASQSKDISKSIDFERNVMDIKLFFAGTANAGYVKTIHAEFEYKKLKILSESDYKLADYFKLFINFNAGNRNLKRTLRSSIWIFIKMFN